MTMFLQRVLLTILALVLIESPSFSRGGRGGGGGCHGRRTPQRELRTKQVAAPAMSATAMSAPTATSTETLTETSTETSTAMSTCTVDPTAGAAVVITLSPLGLPWGRQPRSPQR